MRFRVRLGECNCIFAQAQPIQTSDGYCRWRESDLSDKSGYLAMLSTSRREFS